MDLSDLKKLITGFLVLSALSGSLTLIFLSSTDRTATVSSSSSIGTETQNPLSVGKNAFVEQLPQNSFAPQNGQVANPDSAPADSQTTDTSNLTRNFANIFAQQVIAHNPQGPQLDSNGKPTALNLPTEDSAAALIQQAITSSTFEVDTRISDSDIKILKTYTARDVGNYSTAVTSVLADLASSTARIDATNPSSVPDALAVSQLVLESAFTKLKGAPVPQPLVEFHRSLLQFFANQKKVFETVANYQNDPLKAILAGQNLNQIVDRDLQHLKNEMGKVKKLSLSGGNAELGLIDKILGVEKAYAVLGIGDVVTDPTLTLEFIIQELQTYAKWAWDKADSVMKWLYTTALRIAVKILIDTFQNQVVNWIAGNGNPLFITDWKGFLTDVADKAAGQAISGIYPFLCSNIGPLIRLAVLPVPNLNTSVRCTLTQVIQNVQGFYRNFQTGGWIAYGAALQPQNNFFGGLIIANDAVVRAAASAQDAAKNQAVASQGFLPVKKCVKYQDKDTYGPFGEPPGSCIQEVDATPGAAVGASLAHALDWPVQGIISAQRFEELVGAIINASINRMIKTGLSALTAASNPPPPNFDNAIPLGVSNPGDISAVRSSLQSLVNAHQRQGTFQKFQNVSDADGRWLALKPQVINTLNQVGSSCPSLSSDASQKIAQLNSLQTGVAAEFLGVSANTPDSFRTSIDNATSVAALNIMLGQLQSLDSLTVDTGVAQARLTRLQNLQTSAQANLPNSCNVSLPNP